MSVAATKILTQDIGRLAMADEWNKRIFPLIAELESTAEACGDSEEAFHLWCNIQILKIASELEHKTLGSVRASVCDQLKCFHLPIKYTPETMHVLADLFDPDRQNPDGRKKKDNAEAIAFWWACTFRDKIRKDFNQRGLKSIVDDTLTNTGLVSSVRLKTIKKAYRLYIKEIVTE